MKRHFNRESDDNNSYSPGICDKLRLGQDWGKMGGNVELGLVEEQKDSFSGVYGFMLSLLS